MASLLLLLAVIAVGCKKKEAPAVGNVQIIDASRFFQAFSSSPPEVQVVVDNVRMSIQGSDSMKARFELDRLSKMPGLTDPQQAVVKDLGEQLDKKIAADVNAAAPK
jgi:hypothetical protein